MVIESAFIIHPDFTMKYLTSINFADSYMMTVMNYIDAHDSLLSNRILSISLASLFSLPIDSLPPSYQNEYGNIFQACLTAMNEVVQLRKEGAGEDYSDIDYDAIMEKIQGQSYTQNDWGFDEEYDVQENEDNELELRQLEALGQMENTFKEIDDELVDDVTSIKEVAYLQQAFNVRSNEVVSLCRRVISCNPRLWDPV